VEDILACEEIDWVVDEVGEAAESPSRSRSKYDLWLASISRSTNAKKLPKASRSVELLMHASLIFLEDDFDKVADFLASKGIDPDELHQHFYFHQEWWRERVRLVPHKADEHARWVKTVHAYVQKHMSEYYDKDLEEYFNKFEQ
jgi:hypothetical protein